MITTVMMMTVCISGWLIERTGLGKEYHGRFDRFMGRAELWREYHVEFGLDERMNTTLRFGSGNKYPVCKCSIVVTKQQGNKQYTPQPM